MIKRIIAVVLLGVALLGSGVSSAQAASHTPDVRFPHVRF